MKKILLFVVGLFGFMGMVSADMGNYNGKVVSRSVVVGDYFDYEINFTGPDYINEVIYYDADLLEFGKFDIHCNDSVECHIDEEINCQIKTLKEGEVLLSCDESVLGYIPTLVFKTKKSGEASLKIGGEYADYVTIVKTLSEENKNEPIDTIACKEVAKTSTLELLKEPFVLGIISGFSIVIIILSVMLSKKTKQLKNVQK